jgi:uncharacterized protein YjcR
MHAAEIAGRLDVSARTLQTWKSRGDWDTKRRAYWPAAGLS